MTVLTPVDPPPASPTTPPPDAGPPVAVLHVVAWKDTSSEAEGFDPRSAYVETFWLPHLGPSATLLLRRLADRLEAAPGGFVLGLDETVVALGLGTQGASRTPLRRAVLRCVRFGVARQLGPGTLAVRRRVALLPQGHVCRLPQPLQTEHRLWEEGRRSQTVADVRRRARLVALDLVAVAESPACLERHLVHCGVHPAMAYEAAAWAWTRHSVATTPARRKSP